MHIYSRAKQNHTAELQLWVWDDNFHHRMLCLVDRRGILEYILVSRHICLNRDIHQNNIERNGVIWLRIKLLTSKLEGFRRHMTNSSSPLLLFLSSYPMRLMEITGQDIPNRLSTQCRSFIFRPLCCGIWTPYDPLGSNKS